MEGESCLLQLRRWQRRQDSLGRNPAGPIGPLSRASFGAVESAPQELDQWRQHMAVERSGEIQCAEVRRPRGFPPKIGRDLPKIGRSRMRRCFFSFCDCLSKAGHLLADCCLAWNPVPNPPLAPPGNLFGMAVLGCIFSRWVQGHLDAGRAGSRAMQTIVGPRSRFRAAVVVARPRPRKDAKSPLRHRARYAR